MKFPTHLRRAWLPWLGMLALFAIGCGVTLSGADAQPIGPEAPDPPPASDTPRRTLDRHELVGIFRSAHLRADEVAEHVVAVFGNARAEGRVRENVVAVFGSVETSRRVGGNVVAVFGDVAIADQVSGNVVSIFGEITLAPGTQVHGNVVAVGGYTYVPDNAQIFGQDLPLPVPGVRHLGTWVRECLLYGRLYPHDSAGTWFFVGVMLVLSLLASALFRGPVELGTAVIERRPGIALANGLLAMLLLPPIMLLLAATGIGVFVLPFLWIAMMLATLTGVLALYRFTGARLGLAGNATTAILAGFLVFAAIYAMPVVGLLTWAGVMMFGLGTSVAAWRDSRRREARVSGPPSPTRPPPPSPAQSPFLFNPGATTDVERPGITPPAEGGSDPVATGSIHESGPAAAATGGLPPPDAGQPQGTQPPPPPPLPPEPLERAEFWPRVLANLLDLVFVGVVSGVLSLGGVFIYLWLGYHIAFWAWRGTTLGGVVLNLRIERLDGRPLDFGVALVRALGAIMSFVPFGLGFLWVNWDPEKQSWHDKIAGTVIVRAPRGQALI